MRRDGYIIDEIVTSENMNASFDYVMRGRKRKTSRSGRYIMSHREEVISSIVDAILSGEYKVSGYHEYTISERGKKRKIQSVPLYDRIALNAIMRVVERHLQNRWINTTAASIKGRGMHYLHQRIMKDIKRDTEGTRYAYQIDIKKFYESVDQDIMVDCIKRYFKDDRLINILSRSVRFLPKGISIGKRDSQALGNLLLSHYVDHFIKDQCGVKYYYRYCDDMLTLAESYEKLTIISRILHERVEMAGLRIKSNERFFDINKRPIDFLGYITYGNGHVRMRKGTKKRFAVKWARVRSEKRKVELIGSFYGIAKHGDCGNLFHKLTGMSMRQFADFGLTFTASDGKKRFDCKYYPLGELQNRRIVIEDYESGVRTREGDDRCIVKFRSDELGEGKFITNNEEMKQMLDKINEIDDGFPFETTIKRTSFGQGKTKYSFT